MKLEMPKTAVCFFPCEAKALLELFWLQPIKFSQRQTSFSSVFAQ